MIFPITATNRVVNIVNVDPDNPEHEEHYSKGEATFKQIKNINGIALGYEVFSVMLDDKSVVDEEYILFANEVDGEIELSFVKMDCIKIGADEFNKTIRQLIKQRNGIV
jgi:hypothetical protein